MDSIIYIVIICYSPVPHEQHIIKEEIEVIKKLQESYSPEFVLETSLQDDIYRYLESEKSIYFDSDYLHSANTVWFRSLTQQSVYMVRIRGPCD